MNKPIFGQSNFDSLLQTMRRLRDPVDGCPWDVEQTHLSLRHALLEEAYEALEALDSQDTEKMVEELGDLLIQVIFHAQIGLDNQTFDINDVVLGINEKLIRRHPHIFSDSKVTNSADVKIQWDKIKAQERKDRGLEKQSILDGVPKSMPSLAYAQAIQSRATRAGFKWADTEYSNHNTLASLEGLKDIGTNQERVSALGELLFSVVNSARNFGIEAEDALREANSRFYHRYAHSENAGRDKN